MSTREFADGAGSPGAAAVEVLRPPELDDLLSLIDQALAGLSWHKPGGASGTPLGEAARAVIGAAGPRSSGPAEIVGLRSGERDGGLLAALGVEARGEEAVFAPWSPVVAPGLGLGSAREAARLLVEGALRRAAGWTPAPTRALAVTRFSLPDRDRALELAESYVLAGFDREVRLWLRLDRAGAEAGDPGEPRGAGGGPGASAGPSGAAGAGTLPATGAEVSDVDPADPSQMELLTGLFVQAFADSPDEHGRLTAADREEARRWLAGAAAGERGRYVQGLWRVARVGGRPAGFVLVSGRPPPPGAFYVAEVGVIPEFRGRGLARRLLAEAVQLAWKAGAPTVTAAVSEANLPSRRLFTSLGFSETGGIIVLRRALPPGGPGR